MSSVAFQRATIQTSCRTLITFPISMVAGKDNLIFKLDLMDYPLRQQSQLLINTMGFITWQNIVVNHLQREAITNLIMPKLK